LAAEQNKRITEFIDVTTHKIEDQLDECLRQLDETEQDLLKQVSLHTEERERRCRAIEKIAKEVNVLKDNALTVLAKC
jgi:low affinity Fe/Cu permease